MPIVDRRLTLPALALALGSAALHAAWNVLLGARANDVQAATAATFVLSVALAAPFALVWWSARAAPSGRTPSHRRCSRRCTCSRSRTRTARPSCRSCTR